MTKTDIQEVVKFSIIVLIVLIVLGILHWQTLENYFNVTEHTLLKSYVFNGVFTISAFSLLVYLKQKYIQSIGFIFIGTGFLKFLFFFVLFYPFYTADAKISQMEFAEFFLPYLVCLGLEVYFLIKFVLKD